MSNFKDNRTLWDKAKSMWKNIAKATYETLAPTDLINAAQWEDYSKFWLALDFASVLPWAKLVKAIKWVNKTVKAWDKIIDTTKAVNKTRDQYKATKAAREAFDKKNFWWIDDYKIIDNTRDTKWIIYDWDAWWTIIDNWINKNSWEFKLIKDWKTYTADAKDLTVWDLEDAKIYNIKDRWDINMWNMWWAVTNKKELYAKQIKDTYNSLKWKVSDNKLISIIKKHPYYSILWWATWTAMLAWWEDKPTTWEWSTVQNTTDPNTWINLATTETPKAEDTKQEWLTQKDVNTVVSDIKSKYESWELSKSDAKKALVTVKEYANANFETSIQDNLYSKWLDWSLKSRTELAKALWIEWYKWLYEENVKMLEQVKYLSWEQIKQLLGNK